jgi:hypothetical protein
MIGRVRLLVSIATMLLVPAIVLAQGNVTVTLLRPPPNQLRVADLWKVDLNNMTDRTFTVYLHGTAEEQSDGLIVDARSHEFRLLPRQKVRLTGTMLEPITVDEWHEGYKDVIFRSGQVPTGSYRVCVEVLLAENDSLLGTDCYDQEIEQLSPPILIFPIDESTVVDKYPTFNWLPPTPARQDDRLTYQLRIVEVLGRQTGFDAMESNPAFFDLRDITSNSLRFPIGARGFIVGNTYAWQIRAYMPTRTGERRPIVESEIWTFTYGTIDDQGRDPDDKEGDDDPVLGRGDTPPIRGRSNDIEIVDTDIPTIGTRSKPPVTKDLAIKQGFVPPGIDLAKVIVAKPELMLNLMALRALMHTCQGGD